MKACERSRYWLSLPSTAEFLEFPEEFIGVDVFFVLSGYLITGQLVAEFERTTKISLLQFYARRIRRLLPASTLTLIITLMVCALIMAPQELTFAARAARATTLYMSNVFFSINAADYFAPDVKSNPMLHTWSLAVEEQFYLFWPLLIMFSLQWMQSRKVLLAVLYGLAAGSLGASAYFTAHASTFAFYQLPTRAWEFAIGGLAVLLPWSTMRLPPSCWMALGWLGFLTILGSAGSILGGGDFPGWIALVPVLGTAVALAAGAAQPDRGVGVVLNTRPLQAVGALSYSWYLWHWPFLVLAIALFPNISVIGKIAAAAAALLIAAVTHRFFENPIRFNPYLTRRPSFAIYLAAGMTLCSLSAAALSMRFADYLADMPETRAITTAVSDYGSMPRAMHELWRDRRCQDLHLWRQILVYPCRPLRRLPRGAVV